jgi:hypothetical protein
MQSIPEKRPAGATADDRPQDFRTVPDPGGTKPAVTPELWSIAYHEAGHAIAAAALGVAVEEVSIVPDPERHNLGHCRPADCGRDRDGREKDVIITLGGPAVDDLRGVRRPDPHWFNRKAHPRRGGTYDDWHRAYSGTRALLLELRPDDFTVIRGDIDPREVSIYLRWLYERARLLIAAEHNWLAVAILARRLVREKTLGNREVREAYGAGKGLTRQETVRHLRRLNVLSRYDASAYSLERLLAARDDCDSGRRKPSAVRKELDKEWWDWWWRKEWKARAAATADVR